MYPERIAILSTIAWRTPPRHYGPYETVASMLSEGLVKRGFDVTLFATGDSITAAKLRSVCPRGYEEDQKIDVKVWESLHISEAFEHAGEYDLIHNHFDFLPLSYAGLVSTPMVTTIQGFSSPDILPVYEKYNGRSHYVSISNSHRLPSLSYIATVYHGIDLSQFSYRPTHGDYLLFFARIHPDKGTREAIEIARRMRMKLVIAGLVHDVDYFSRWIQPQIDNDRVTYVGSVDPIQRNTIMGGAFALLHPINFDEPFGLSVIEAMACGTPAVVFNRGSMREILEDGENGFLVSNVEEAVDALQRIPQLNRSRCRRTVERRFTADIMVENYIKVYQDILNVTRVKKS